MCRRKTKIGWTPTVRPRSRSHRKRRIAESSLLWSQEKRGVGVQLVRQLRRSGYSSISRKASDASRSSSKKPKQSVHKNSSCDGLQMAGAHFEQLCASSRFQSPPSTIHEVEEYRVELSDVTVLELVIVPDISRRAVRASLKRLRLD